MPPDWLTSFMAPDRCGLTAPSTTNGGALKLKRRPQRWLMTCQRSVSRAGWQPPAIPGSSASVAFRSNREITEEQTLEILRQIDERLSDGR